MNVLLDSHTFLWMSLDDQKLSSTARDTLGSLKGVRHWHFEYQIAMKKLSSYLAFCSVVLIALSFWQIFSGVWNDDGFASRTFFRGIGTLCPAALFAIFATICFVIEKSFKGKD